MLRTGPGVASAERRTNRALCMGLCLWLHFHGTPVQLWLHPTSPQLVTRHRLSAASCLMCSKLHQVRRWLEGQLTIASQDQNLNAAHVA